MNFESVNESREPFLLVVTPKPQINIIMKHLGIGQSALKKTILAALLLSSVNAAQADFNVDFSYSGGDSIITISSTTGLALTTPTDPASTPSNSTNRTMGGSTWGLLQFVTSGETNDVWLWDSADSGFSWNAANKPPVPSATTGWVNNGPNIFMVWAADPRVEIHLDQDFAWDEAFEFTIVNAGSTLYQGLEAESGSFGFNTGAAWLDQATWSVQAIPEPASAAMLFGCLALASVMIRRRRQ